MDDPSKTSQATVANPSSLKGALKDDLVVTHHRSRIGDRELPYTVTTGTLVLKEEREGKGEHEGRWEGETPRATVFFIAYTLEDAEPGERPLTFSFNGGPGSSSVWLHLGLLGPRRVRFDAVGHPLPPPYELIDNEHALLDVSDLVFIDPVSTGYSRAAPGEKAKDFHGFKEDIASVGDFIRLYCSRYGRWLSPKFLIGESYGTTRAAGLAGYLQERHGMFLNGVMLVSSILDFATARFEPGNDLPYLLFLPSYAATAWYHQRLEGELQALELRAFLAEVERFVMHDYSLALMKGATLGDEETRRVAKTLARFTGLAEDYLLQSKLRVDIMRFCKALLRDERRTVGRLDSRFTGSDRDAAGEFFEYDPSYATIQGPFTATFNHYVREELGFGSDLPYEILSNLYQTWSYKDFENRYVNVAETLRKAMTMNPFLKVHVASGLFDLATPYFATDYTLNHLGLEPELQGNLSTSLYPAGHMMYVHLESLAALKRALARFVLDAA